MAKLPESIIKAIQEHGFDVYMQDREDSYAIYADGNNIGYVEHSGVHGVRVSTIHKPETPIGCGFGDIDCMYAIPTKDNLLEGLSISPKWTKGMWDHLVKKYNGVSEYNRVCNSNDLDYREYLLVQI